MATRQLDECPFSLLRKEDGVWKIGVGNEKVTLGFRNTSGYPRRVRRGTTGEGENGRSKPRSVGPEERQRFRVPLKAQNRQKKVDPVTREVPGCRRKE